MSALGQLIEQRGIPTIALGLVRLQMEKIEPPRGLWTPFQLGRPLGEPEDRGFQRRVLIQAMTLLEREDGPVILEDFPDDPPGWSDRAGWHGPSIAREERRLESANAWQAALRDEIELITPLWARARERFGRTTVGVSSMPPQAWPAFMASFLDGERPEGRTPTSAPPALALRFAVDDLKAFYTEAAQAAGEAPASRQVDAWFWRETLAGRFLQVLRRYGMASDHPALKAVSGAFLVPGPWVEPLPS